MKLSCYKSSQNKRSHFMSRPGRTRGNSNLQKYYYKQKYDWRQPCTAQLGVRVPPYLLKELKAIDNWQEKVRVAIADLVENNPE